MSATLPTYDVHLGHWVNWSFGLVRGSTITMSRQNGALLTAFTAIFVSVCAFRRSANMFRTMTAANTAFELSMPAPGSGGSYASHFIYNSQASPPKTAFTINVKQFFATSLPQMPLLGIFGQLLGRGGSIALHQCVGSSLVSL